MAIVHHPTSDEKAEAERRLRRFKDSQLDPAELAAEIDVWLRQRALYAGDIEAGDFAEADADTLAAGIDYCDARLAELTKHAERLARAHDYPTQPGGGDLTTRFQSARWADLVGLAETLTGEQAVKSGSRHRIRCPFHAGDRDPSLTIYQPGDGWHCFGCGRGGDVVAFCMEFFHCSAVEALRMVEQLADTYPAAWQAVAS